MKWPLTAPFFTGFLAAKGHFCELLVSNIFGYLSFSDFWLRLSFHSSPIGKLFFSFSLKREQLMLSKIWRLETLSFFVREISRFRFFGFRCLVLNFVNRLKIYIDRSFGGNFLKHFRFFQSSLFFQLSKIRKFGFIIISRLNRTSVLFFSAARWFW